MWYRKFCMYEIDHYVLTSYTIHFNLLSTGGIAVSGKTKWDVLDTTVRRVFKEFILRIDPSSNLGMNTDSVLHYNIGEIQRSKDSELPELLPCGYLVSIQNNSFYKLNQKLASWTVFFMLMSSDLLSRSNFND